MELTLPVADPEQFPRGAANSKGVTAFLLKEGVVTCHPIHPLDPPLIPYS